MKLDILEPKGVAQPQGMYNHAIMTSTGRLLFISGQVAIDENIQLVGPGDFNAQIQQVLKKRKDFIKFRQDMPILQIDGKNWIKQLGFEIFANGR